jgi:hypothetical protein
MDVPIEFIRAGSAGRDFFYVCVSPGTWKDDDGSTRVESQRWAKSESISMEEVSWYEREYEQENRVGRIGECGKGGNLRICRGRA